MRKSNKRITDLAIITDLLGRSPVGRLGTVGADGWPMVKPLNFAYHAGRIYFHCALEGEKLDHIAHDSRVCFQVDLPIAYVNGTAENACRATFLYRCVIIRGRARLVDDEAEKVQALTALMAKHQPTGSFGPFPAEALAVTGVVRIDIEEMVGKESLRDGAVRERALAALAAGQTLPFVIE
jgi:nitroimidazol reductase NimA-like FMN-containing flavoprotein (pyridoxamine 5'-phosphate oxidase superfamily)